MNTEVNLQNDNSEKSVFKRLIDIIFEPRSAFESIIKKPKMLIPLLLICFAFLVITVVTLPISENYTRDYLENLYKSDSFLKSQAQITIDNADTFIDKSIKVQKISSFANPIIILIIILLQAVVFYVLFKIFGGVGSFTQTFASTVYAYVIKVIGAIVLTINILISGNISSTNSLAIFLTDDKTNYLYNLLSKLDVFSIWYFILLAFGLSIVHKVSPKKAYIGVLSLWIIFVLGSAAVTTFSAMTIYNQYGITM